MLELNRQLFEELSARQWVGTVRPAVYGEGGMTPGEIEALERELGFSLPPDFAVLLRHLVDPGDVLFNYRSFSKRAYERAIERLLEGLFFSFDHDRLWMKRWGDKPSDPEAAKNLIRSDFATWPRLLPIYGHRFLAAEPCVAGNPVFSIMGSDMICYGANLAHYLMNEFVDHDYKTHVINVEIRDIPIWSDFSESRKDAFVESYFTA